MFNKLYITIKSNEHFDNSIISPINAILVNSGIDKTQIAWDTYPTRAKLEINTEYENYHAYHINSNNVQTIVDICHLYELVITIIDSDDINETYTTYYSKENSKTFETDTTRLLD